MPKRHSASLFRSFFKFLVSAFAIILIIIGIIVAPSPIPFGIVFIALGVLILSTVAPDMVRWIRRRWRWFDRVITKLEKWLPGPIARQLRRSNVNPNDDEDEEENGR